MTIEKKSIEVLKNCFLVRPGEDRRKQMLCFQHGELAEIDGAPQDTKGLPAVYLRKSYRDDFLNLLREVEIALTKNKIFGASSLLAEAVLVMSIAYRQTTKPIALAHMLSDYRNVEATAFVGIPFLAVIMTGQSEPFLLGVRMGRFVLGGHALHQHRTLFSKYPIEKNNSNSSDREIENAFWMMREAFDCRVLSSAFDALLTSDYRDLYLSHLAGALVKEFKADFAQDQGIPVALGAPAFDLNSLFSLDQLKIGVAFGEQGSISLTLLNDGSRSISSNIAELDLKERLFRKLEGKNLIGTCPDIDRMLGTFSRFLLKAKAHETGSRSSDAFIHCVFALDLALGTRQDTTKNITRRAAVIYSAASEVHFKVAEKELRSIFEARSKYVHEGAEISVEKFSLLLEICSLIAECLLRARASTNARSEKFITEHWYPRLDLLVAAMIAGVELTSEHFRECGVREPSEAVPKIVH